MTEQIRLAVSGDVGAMAAMASRRREQYAEYQPVFWRVAANAEQLHRPYLARLVADPGVITLVSEESGALTGFVIATIVGAPAVYDPGGQTCQIDDFVVLPGRWDTTGRQLLAAATGHAAERGAVQVVVVVAHLDELKRDALRASGLTIASEWWTAPTSAPTRE